MLIVAKIDRRNLLCLPLRIIIIKLTVYRVRENIPRQNFHFTEYYLKRRKKDFERLYAFGVQFSINLFIQCVQRFIKHFYVAGNLKSRPVQFKSRQDDFTCTNYTINKPNEIFLQKFNCNLDVIECYRTNII